MVAKVKTPVDQQDLALLSPAGSHLSRAHSSHGTSPGVLTRILYDQGLGLTVVEGFEL